MAYVSYDQAPSIGVAPRTESLRTSAPRLAWGRIAMIAGCAAFWIGVAFAARAIF